MRLNNNQNAVLTTNSEVPYFTFPSLSNIEYIKHGFSSRLGGVSKGHLESMNLGFFQGDDPGNVTMNYKRICNSIGIDVNNLVLSDQVHNTVVKLVTKEDKGKGITIQRDYKGIDGLITNTPGIPLVTFYADCVPLYFVDTKNHAIGLSHSGWRGTVNKMGQVTLQEMNTHFGTNPKDVIAVIGPSICKECYEVSQDVAEEFQNIFSNSQINDILTPKEGNKYLLDLWSANYNILKEAGMNPDNITISGVCTCCNSDLLFSHRATGGKRGLLGAFLMLDM